MSIQRYSLSAAVTAVSFPPTTSSVSHSQQPAANVATAADAQQWQQLCEVVPPGLAISVLPQTPASETLCLLLEVSKYLIFPHQTSTINEQGKRSVVRQAMLALGISCRTATKQELNALRALGSLSVNAPTATWITVKDSCRLLLRYDQHQWAAILAKLFDIDLAALSNMGYARHTIVPHQTDYRRSSTSSSRRRATRSRRNNKSACKGKHGSKRGSARSRRSTASADSSMQSGDSASGSINTSDGGSDQEYAPRGYLQRRAPLLRIRNAVQDDYPQHYGALGITSATHMPSHSLQLNGQHREPRARSDSAAMPYSLYQQQQQPPQYQQYLQLKPKYYPGGYSPVKVEAPDTTASLPTDSEDSSARQYHVMYSTYQQQDKQRSSTPSSNDRQEQIVVDRDASSRMLHSGSESSGDEKPTFPSQLYQQRNQHIQSPPRVATYLPASTQLPATPTTPPGVPRSIAGTPYTSSSMRPDLLEMSAGIAQSPRNNDMRALQVDVGALGHNGMYGGGQLSPHVTYSVPPPAHDFEPHMLSSPHQFSGQLSEMRFPPLQTMPSTAALYQAGSAPPLPAPSYPTSTFASPAAPYQHHMMTPPSTPRLHTPASFLSPITASSRLQGAETHLSNCSPFPTQHQPSHNRVNNTTPAITNPLLDSPRSSQFFTRQH